MIEVPGVNVPVPNIFVSYEYFITLWVVLTSVHTVVPVVGVFPPRYNRILINMVSIPEEFKMFNIFGTIF